MKRKLHGATAMASLDGLPAGTNKPVPVPVTCTMPDVTVRTGISRTEQYRLMRAGKLQAVKMGRSTLVVWASVEAYLATLPPVSLRPIKKAA